MSVKDYIDLYVKKPSCTVRFNGNRSRDIISIELQQSMDNLTGATINLLSNPGITPETSVQIAQGYNGQEQVTFTGLVDTIERNNVDRSYIVQARDLLKKAMDTFLVQEVKFGVDQAAGLYYYSTYDSADGGTFRVHEYTSLSALNANHPETSGNITEEGAKAHAVVQWLLHMSGLEEGTQIVVDDSSFFIGDLSPAKFHLTSVYDAAMQIANLIGWRIFCDQSGVCRFKKRPRNPSSFYPIWRYYDRQEPYNIQKLSRNESNVDLRTYVEVRGASGIRYVTRGTSPYLGNTPYRGVLISEELIDTPGMAQFVGNRVLNDLNRLKITVSLEADGNPLLIPGSTLSVSSAICEGNYLTESVQTTMSAEAGYKLSANASSFFGDAAFEEPPLDIYACFTALQTVSIGDPKYMVEFDGGCSFSSVGPIVNYSWLMPNGQTYNNGATTNIWWTFDEVNITNGNSQTVSLTVTDALGNTATVASGITLEWLQSQNSIKYRHLYVAFDSKAICSTDGGLTWPEQPIPAVSVAASNFAISGAFTPSGHALFGTSDGKIYKTIDALQTVYQVFSPGSVVNDINIPELDATFAVAGCEDGKIYRSVTAGETWTEIGDFAFSILQVKHDYTNFDHITVLGAGNDNLYETFDAGGSWGHIATGLDGLWLADSNVNNYEAHTTGIKNLSSNTELATGLGPFPALTYAINVDDNSTPGAGIMAVDSNGQHYIYSGGMQATQLNASNKTRHMIRDGEVPMLVYYAVASGVGKSLDKNVTMSGLYYPLDAPPSASGWGRKIAYGPLAAPLTPARLFMRGLFNTVNADGATSSTNHGWAGVGASGWQPIPGVGTEPLSENYAVGAGYFLWGDSAINATKFPLEGLPIVAAGLWVKGGTQTIRGIYLSRKIAASGSTPRVFGLVEDSNDGLNPIPDLYVWTNIFSDPATFNKLEAPQGGPNDHRKFNIFPMRTMPRNLDNVNFTVRQALFEDNNRTYVFPADNTTLDGTDTSLWREDDTGGAGSLFLYPYPTCMLSTVYKWIVYGDSTVDPTPGGPPFDKNYYHQPGAGSLPEVVTPPGTGETGVVSFWDSSVVQSEVYYHVSDFDGVQDPSSHGVFKATAYGQMSSTTVTQLFIPPSGYHVHRFSVTHDTSEVRDYLALVLQPQDGNPATNYMVRYSTDGGSLWQNGPDFTVPLGGSVKDIYYIDTR